MSEYRVYRQGDDPKRIDWRLLARSDRAYIRLAEDRSIVSTLIVVDATASMAFPPDTLGKWKAACEIAIGLAAVAHASRDPVGLVIDKRGALLVADDVGNTIWRLTAKPGTTDAATASAPRSR